MTNVTVLAKTQRIVVDPATSSVSVINAGPQGPRTAETVSVLSVQSTPPTVYRNGQLWLDPDDDTIGGALPDGSLIYSRLGYGPRLEPGLIWCYVGDSITHGTGTPTTGGTTTITRAFMGQSLQMVGALIGSMQSIEAGTGGDTSTDVLNRLDTIMSRYFRASVLMIGTNDLGADHLPLATTISNITNIVARLRTRGPVVLCTIPPRGYTSPDFDPTAEQQYAIDGINLWIRTFGPGLGCTISDNFSAIVDISDGSNVSAWNNADSLHPNTKGHYLIGATVAKAMLEASSNVSAPNGLIVTDSISCLTPDPLCVGGTTMPSGWSEQAGGTGTAPTYSLLDDSSNFLPTRVKASGGTQGAMTPGKWMQLAWTATSGGTRIVEIPVDNAEWAVGDSVAICAHLQIDDVAGTNPWWFDVVSGTAVLNLSVIDQTSTEIVSTVLDHCPGIPYGLMYNVGPIVWPFTIPVGITGMKLLLTVTLPTGAQRNIRIGNTGLINLTKLALDTTIGAWTNTIVRT